MQVRIIDRLSSGKVVLREVIPLSVMLDMDIDNRIISPKVRKWDMIPGCIGEAFTVATDIKCVDDAAYYKGELRKAGA
jgi:hypothetical protein